MKNEKFSKIFINKILWKRAQSEIISTVLLITISIIAIVIITAFAIPFVQERLSGAKCIDLAGKVIIKNNPDYTCYNDTKKNLTVQVHFGDIEKEAIKGIQIIVNEAGSSSSFEIINGSVSGTNNVYMFSGSDIELPGKNEERTYILININSRPEAISIYPFLENKKTCPDVSESLVNIDNCV